VRLLLLEDDDTLGGAICYYLQSEGHLVDLCPTLGQAKILISEPYDALLLDWNLPDGSGIEWLAGLRARGVRIPAIVLTAHDQLAERIQSLDAGADDYLVKPFALEELAARVRAVIRRSSGNETRKQLGRVEVDLTGRAVWLDGLTVDLTGREWTLLEALVLRTGRIVSKLELESLVIGLEGDVNSNLLEVYISKLRHKLGRELIETVRGLGYRIP
jgi:two-component system OmpR family response regulator